MSSVPVHYINPEFWNKNVNEEFYTDFETFKKVIFKYISSIELLVINYGKILLTTPFLPLRERHLLAKYNCKPGYNEYSTGINDISDNYMVTIEITLAQF